MLWLMLAAPWLVGALLTLGLPRLAALFTPEWMTRVLAVTAVVLAITTWTSALASATIAIHGSTSARAAAILLLGGWLLWTTSRAVRHGRRVAANMRAGKLFRDCPGRVGGVLVVDSAIPDAFAVPGPRAVVVVTSALAAKLDGDEFRAVVEHERAHLAGGHSVLIQTVELAALLNPLMSRWVGAVRFAAERAADERAATGDRAAALRAVARAALLCSAAVSSAGVGIGGRPGEVLRRVDALQRPAPRAQRRWLVIAAAAVVVGLSANLVVLADVAQDRMVPEPDELTGAVFG